MIMHPRRPSVRDREGATLVEILLVVFLVVILAVYIGPEFLRASRNERNLRNEAFVRSKLVMHLASLERYLSLGTNVVATGGAIQVAFPVETGGVAMEANLVRVYTVKLTPETNVVTTVLSRKNEDFVRYDEPRHGRGMGADPILLTVPLETRISAMHLEGNGQVRRISLCGEFPWSTGYGTHTNTVTVSRLVRIWNSPK